MRGKIKRMVCALWEQVKGGSGLSIKGEIIEFGYHKQVLRLGKAHWNSSMGG